MPKKRVSKKSSARGSTQPATSNRKPARKQAREPARKQAREPAAAKKAATRKAGAGKDDAPLSQLERLIAMMVEKEVVEVEYEQSGTRWRVRRAEAPTVAYAQAAPMPMAMPAVAMPGAAQAAAAEAESQGEVFKSPMVGTFYRAASPDAEPFCKAGDQVTGDKTLCIIEAMKVMNDIKAEREFEVVKVLVENGDPVEFGQPLFLIR